MQRRGKRRPLIAVAVAVARELAGFCWAIAPDRITDRSTCASAARAAGTPAFIARASAVQL
jgi:hypothetical protein